MDGRLLGGRYRLLESHAMGGMASVWRATDEETGEVVAVKRLHPHLVADADARERLLREATALETIRHPNIVAIRDVVDGDEPALVMDLVEGSSVAELVAEGHRFTRSEALGIAAGIADGLAAAHARGIVHRDVKPANVLIGQDGLARLSDFGIAVGADDDTSLTAEDGVIGTLRYLAPERLAGKTATPATDVWGVGAMLYELLTGDAAFPASTPAERVELASRPVDRPKGLAEGIWTVLSTCLATDPLDRFPDGAALAAALHALPAVPAAAAEASVDPFAVTRVIAVPAEEDTSQPPEPATRDPAVQPFAAVQPLAKATGAWVRPHAGRLVALAGAFVLAAMVVSSLGVGTPGDGRAVSIPSSGATAMPPSPVPTLAEPTPVESAAADKPGKGKGNGKGKGSGRGN